MPHSVSPGHVTRNPGSEVHLEHMWTQHPRQGPQVRNPAPRDGRSCYHRKLGALGPPGALGHGSERPWPPRLPVEGNRCRHPGSFKGLSQTEHPQDLAPSSHRPRTRPRAPVCPLPTGSPAQPVPCPSPTPDSNSCHLASRDAQA